MEQISFAELREWRRKYKVSQKKLADLANISVTTLQQLETDKHKPQRKTRKRILDAVKKIENSPEKYSKISRKSRRKRVEPVVVERETVSLPESMLSSPNSELAPEKTVSDSGRVALTNIDLELINRMMSMTIEEKLTLLKQLL